MIIARHLIKLSNLSKTTPFFKFSTTYDNHEFLNQEGEQTNQRIYFKKAAIILSGCGVHDGSEVTEAVSLMVHLNKLRVDFQCFAPDQNQMHVINHITGEVTNETRNVLVESARIARGQVKNLTELQGQDYQAVFLPGGFGAAKNLSDYAVKGTSFTVHSEVERVLREFHTLKKPIGAICISPVILAKVFQNEKPKITLGKINKSEKANYWPYSDAINIAESLGAKHSERSCESFQVDLDNKLVSVPAMMFNGFFKFHQSFESIGIMTQIIQQLVLGKNINFSSYQNKEGDNSNQRQERRTQDSDGNYEHRQPRQDRRNFKRQNQHQYDQE